MIAHKKKRPHAAASVSCFIASPFSPQLFFDLPLDLFVRQVEFPHHLAGAFPLLIIVAPQCLSRPFLLAGIVPLAGLKPFVEGVTDEGCGEQHQ
jgi:hypothetical protein